MMTSLEIPDFNQKTAEVEDKKNDFISSYLSFKLTKKILETS